MRSTTWVLRASVSVPCSAAIRVREKKQTKRTIVPANYNRVVFTEEMRKNYTILCPQMSPIHFELSGAGIPDAAGYNLELFRIWTAAPAWMSDLKYVNNDACYPSLIVVGQLMACRDVRQI